VKNPIVFLVSLLILSPVFAQVSSDALANIDDPHLRQEGQLFSIRLSPGKPLKIFVVGREEAKFDFSNMKLTVKRLKPYPSEELRVTKSGDYYTVATPLPPEQESQLEVTTQVKGKSEKFHFLLKQKKP